MTTLLQIDSSGRNNRSHTRRLTSCFVQEWLARSPETRLIKRDLTANPPPLVTEQWIASAFTAEGEHTVDQEAILASSDRYIDELEQTDIIVMGAPMYNYGMPAVLKAWFDQVIRVDRTFTFDPEEDTWSLSPILNGKTLVIMSSRGEFGFEPGGIRDAWNHLETHIRTLQHFLGVESSHLIAVEYQEFNDERHALSIAKADCELKMLIEELSTHATVVEQPKKVAV